MVDFDDNTWWEAQYAPTSRSSCKEFRCKQKIEEGSLRLGLMREECDHYGNNLGWYHPECLWKTFNYKQVFHPIIDSPGDIKNWNSLDASAKEELKELMEARKAGRPPRGKASDGASSGSKGTLQVRKLPNGDLEVTGNTFDVKDKLKVLGARWNGPTKSWVFGHPLTRSKLCEFLHLDETTLSATRTTVDLSKLPQDAEGASQEAAGAADAEEAEKGQAAKKRRVAATGAAAGAGGGGAVLENDDPASRCQAKRGGGKGKGLAMALELQADLSKTPVTRLKVILQARGLKHTGVKDDLIQRILTDARDRALPDSLEYRTQMYRLVQQGWLSGLGAKDLPWAQDGTFL